MPYCSTQMRCLPITHDERFDCPFCSLKPSERLHFPRSNYVNQNKLIAQFAIIHYQIRRAAKWGIFNILVISAILADWVDFSNPWNEIILTFCCFNVCFYITTISSQLWLLFKLEIDSTRLMQYPYPCLKNGSNSLVRYFEDNSVQFLKKYWLLFENAIKYFPRLQLFNRCSGLGKIGMAHSLKEYGRYLQLESVKQLELQRKCKDAAYQVTETMYKYSKKTFYSTTQLVAYWADYQEALKNETIRDSKAYSCADSGSPNNTSSFQSDIIPIPAILSRLHYQISSTTFDPLKLRKATEDRSSYIINISTLHLWCFNIKQWLGCKIRELVEQVHMANSTLKSCGIPNVQIGLTDLTTMQDMLLCHPHLVPFSHLTLFLSLSQNQGYLWWRYKALASDSSLRLYSWNSDKDNRQEGWSSVHTPCDSDLILHFFASYLDHKLMQWPSLPRCYRPFSKEHILLQPVNTGGSRVQLTGIAIVRSSTCPPHFDVFLGSQKQPIPPGPANLFFALAYFIFCVKLYRNGKIGTKSLGKHDLNMLWIVGDNMT